MKMRRRITSRWTRTKTRRIVPWPNRDRVKICPSTVKLIYNISCILMEFEMKIVGKLLVHAGGGGRGHSELLPQVLHPEYSSEGGERNSGICNTTNSNRD